MYNFIEKAKEVHGDKYDYSLVEYVNANTKVKIICPEHGEFLQVPKDHLKNHGCYDCGIEKRTKKITFTLDQFIEKANGVHNNKYDYSKVNYINANTKVEIICQDHGVFWQKPIKHINNENGCPECGKIRENKDVNKILTNFKKIHGDKYDYSKINYKGAFEKIEIICRKHGSFWQTPNSHTSMKAGCQKCANEQSSKKRSNTFKWFIDSASFIHGDKYDYSKVVYTNCKTKVEIICSDHGSFWQSPSSHIYTQNGCPKCTYQISKTQLEIYDFVKSLDDSAILEDRTNYPGLQLDITVPSRNLAIEYNGSFWHSINQIDNSRYQQFNHIQEKTIQIRKAGLDVLHIYEHEWVSYPNIVKQYIRDLFENKLTIPNNHIFDAGLPIPNGYKILKYLPPEYFILRHNKLISKEKVIPTDLDSSYLIVPDCGTVLCE